MKNFSDVTELMAEMHIAGVATDASVAWIARLIKLGKAAERTAQEMRNSGVSSDLAGEWIARAFKIGNLTQAVAYEQERRQAIREKVEAEVGEAVP